MNKDRKEESSRKLFVGGLNYETTDDELKEYFQRYGTLDDYVVMRFPDGSRRSRGFGFITFSSVDELENCFAAQPHTLHDKTVELKRATPRETSNGGKRRYDEGADEPVDPEDKIMRKLFIGGLSYNTTDEAMREYFERYGSVEDAVIMKFPDSSRSRGFGFITYEKAASVDACQKDRPHTIDARTIDTKRATPRSGGSSGVRGRSDDASSQATSKKLFVGNLSEAMTDDDLSDYFSQYGQVTNVEQLKWNDTQKKRGFGFIEFDDHDAVDKACLFGRHLVMGKSLEVRKALSKHEMAGMKKAKMEEKWGRGGGGDYGGQMAQQWGRGGGGGGMHQQDQSNMNPMMMMNMMMGMMNGQQGGGGGGAGHKSYTSFSGQPGKQERGFGSSAGGAGADASGYNSYGGYASGGAGGYGAGGGAGGYGGGQAAGGKSGGADMAGMNWSAGYGMGSDGGWGQYSGANSSQGGGAMRNSSNRDSSGPYYRQ